MATADKNGAKTKFFRVAVEGQTTDGRAITRDQIAQMAANYSATKYGARVNLEHFRGVIPDGPFRAYGDVLALESRELDGEFKGKLGLYAQISPTNDLVAMTKARQKIYTSIELDPSFSDTKQAYMVGLAVTDSPASLGTEVLTFAAQNPAASPFAAKKQKTDNLFSSAVDEVTIELEEPAAPSLFAKVMETLGLVKAKGAADDSRFSDITQAVETLATHGSEQATAFATQAATVKTLQGEVADVKASGEKDRQAFADLKAQLEATGTTKPRPAATGGATTNLTDC